MSDAPVRPLEPIEQRILGSLLEKQRTVPGSYPLTQNALRTACNQSTSRDPVTDYDDRTLHEALRTLTVDGLIRTVWTGTGSRAVKYHQLLAERLQLLEPQEALLTVLLLRGPQSSGELRGRTDRLHAFADRDAVETELRALAGLGLVAERPAANGRTDPRWVHLLGPVAAEPDPVPAAAALATLSMSPDERDQRVLETYDLVAHVYAQARQGRLEEDPFECWFLEQVALDSPGPILDAGCGPGYATAHLAAHGSGDVTGMDVSEQMLEQARSRYPEIAFEQGDLTRAMRPRAAAGWGTVVCWDSLLHFEAGELPAIFAGLARILVPGGRLALSMMLGNRVEPTKNYRGIEVDLDTVLHDRETVLAAVRAAGLDEIQWYVRNPGHVPAERFYLLATRPAAEVG